MFKIIHYYSPLERETLRLRKVKSHFPVMRWKRKRRKVSLCDLGALQADPVLSLALGLYTGCPLSPESSLQLFPRGVFSSSGGVFPGRGPRSCRAQSPSRCTACFESAVTWCLSPVRCLFLPLSERSIRTGTLPLRRVSRTEHASILNFLMVVEKPCSVSLRCST